MTQPTIGFGSTSPSPRRANSSASGHVKDVEFRHGQKSEVRGQDAQAIRRVERRRSAYSTDASLLIAMRHIALDRHSLASGHSSRHSRCPKHRSALFAGWHAVGSNDLAGRRRSRNENGWRRFRDGRKVYAAGRIHESGRGQDLSKSFRDSFFAEMLLSDVLEDSSHSLKVAETKPRRQFFEVPRGRRLPGFLCQRETLFDMRHCLIERFGHECQETVRLCEADALGELRAAQHLGRQLRQCPRRHHQPGPLIEPDQNVVAQLLDLHAMQPADRQANDVRDARGINRSGHRQAELGAKLVEHLGVAVARRSQVQQENHRRSANLAARTGGRLLERLTAEPARSESSAGD